jgi:hypothetical protein
MKIMEQNVYTASETFNNFFTWVDILFLTFFSDPTKFREGCLQKLQGEG